MSDISVASSGKARQTLLRLSDLLVLVERTISRVLVGGFAGLITVNVAMRYFVGRPIIYAEELAAILLVWLAFIAVSISIHDRSQVGVTLLVDYLPAKAANILSAVVNAIILTLLAVLV
ncbi:MAG: TRAP transporter small permease subunit, partial [Paracoccus sp. (in: a-proteobacteria)]|nr:TRAP transporter small permease subunit [Paracoccus sp. (in: a-proteobacteria)]